MSTTFDIKDNFEKLNASWLEFKELHKKGLDELKTKGATSAYVEECLAKINQKIDEADKKHALALAEAKAAAGKPEQSEKEAKDELKIKRKEAFDAYVIYGDQRMSDEYKKLLVKDADPSSALKSKALSSSNDAGGGYLVVPEYEAAIIKTITEFSPVRQVARVRPTSTGSVKIPKRTGTFSASWVAEQGTRSETTGLAYGLEEIPNHEMYALVDISQQQLEDSVFNMESEINMEAGEQFAVAEGTAFISGNGVGKPFGITSNTSIGAVTGGNASTHLLEADDYVSALYTLKAEYARNAVWMLNRKQVGAARKLKFKISTDTVGYVWAPGFAADAPATILGVPYVEATDMTYELTSSAASGKICAVVGDFRRGYVISDRVQISLFRDPYTQATSGNVRFIARKRVGGQVVLPEAICKITTG